ncbi:MAG: hypothetical protein ABSH20_09320 [Tepidisphaeraceae bacterium]|jgi:hypothetical protein
MKMNYRVSTREKWILAFSPAVLMAGVYVFMIVGGLTEELGKQQKRAQAATVPLAPPAPSATLAEARKKLADIKRDIAERETRIASAETRINELESQIEAVSRSSIVPNVNLTEDQTEAARVIERVESIFARNKINPRVSESATDGKGNVRAPLALVEALFPKSNLELGGRQRVPRVWHCVFSDVTPRFERALKEVLLEAPTVVPLSMNLVYNPEDDGETRLLELWLLY